MSFNPTMSLYIPRVYANITQKFIIKVFEEKIRFGKIRSVHMQKIPHSKNNYSAIINFESWNETIVTTNFQTRIFKQGFARVVHDDPWYWIVMENNTQIVHPERIQDAAEAQDTAEAQDPTDNTNQRLNHYDPKIMSQEFFELVNGIVNRVKQLSY
jgi:hypothetical protein